MKKPQILGHKSVTKPRDIHEVPRHTAGGCRRKGVSLAEGNGKSFTCHAPIPFACPHRAPGSHPTHTPDPCCVTETNPKLCWVYMCFLRCSDQPNQGSRGLWVAQWLNFLLLLLSRKHKGLTSFCSVLEWKCFCLQFPNFPQIRKS